MVGTDLVDEGSISELALIFASRRSHVKILI